MSSHEGDASQKVAEISPTDILAYKKTSSQEVIAALVNRDYLFRVQASKTLQFFLKIKN